MSAVFTAYGDGVVFTGEAGNTASFTLLGGKYLFFVGGTFTSAQVSLLGPDGSTYIGVGTALTAAGTAVLDLCPGTYMVSASATSLMGGVVRVPYRAA